MSTQVVSTSMVANVITLLRQRQKSLVKRGKANPAMTMLALTAVLYYWLGRMRAKKGPPRGKAIPRLKSNFFMMDVAYTYLKSRIDGTELKFVQDLSKQGLTLTTEVVGHCLILAFEPSSVQHILVKNFENYPKGKCSMLPPPTLLRALCIHLNRAILVQHPTVLNANNDGPSPHHDGTCSHLIFTSPQHRARCVPPVHSLVPWRPFFFIPMSLFKCQRPACTL